MSMAVGTSTLKCDMNVTPFIDVLLVLLIIFMVIAPVTPKGLAALVPQPAKPNEQPSQSDLRTVVITIEKDKSLKINQDAVTEADLQTRLEDIFKSRAERVVFVKGDPDLEYGPVANVIDTAHAAGIDKVGLMTQKVESGQ